MSKNPKSAKTWIFVQPKKIGPGHNQPAKTESYFQKNENARMTIFQLKCDYRNPKGSLESFFQ